MKYYYLLIFTIFVVPICHASEYHGQKDRYNENALRNDPEVLQSTGNPGKIVNTPEFSVQYTTIDKLDRLIKSFTYDTKGTTISESKTPDQVMETKSGNCFDVARLAFYELVKEGYNAHIIDIKVGDSGWHSICAFQEIDGTWSYFQANFDQMGYFKVHASTVEAMLKDQFINPTDVKFVI